MKKDYKKKLAQYSTLASGLVAISNNSNAQIIYNDFADVVISTSTSFSLDLDNNSTNDITLTMSRTSNSYSGYYYSSVYSAVDLYVSGVFPVVNSNAAKVQRLDFDAVIDANSLYDSSPPFLFFNAYTSQNGAFTGMTDANASWAEGDNDYFMGFKFVNGATTHYGWLLLSIGTGYTATLKEVAIQSTPDAPITAGQMVTSIFASDSETSKVVMNEESLLLKDMTAAGQVTVLNSTGKEVLNKAVSIGNNEYSTASFAPGVYIVRVNLNEKVIVKKVSIN
ncbi:MAG: T9SS type A sorting domain-containing protein [Cytophagaceae bacterium]|jgi:hypothetical protein|nr:T9SS type A sorting domain-containing protein [Cytophagaceae bacterium]